MKLQTLEEKWNFLIEDINLTPRGHILCPDMSLLVDMPTFPLEDRGYQIQSGHATDTSYVQICPY